MGFGNLEAQNIRSGLLYTKGASNKYVRLDGGRGGQPKAYSVNKAM